MIKHTNPFYTIEESVAVLKNLGANPAPVPIPFRYDENAVYWQDHVISVKANRVYDDHYEHHFEVEIHIDKEGFDALVRATGLETIQKEKHSEEYDIWFIRPGTLLQVFTLVPKEAVQ